MSKVIHIITRLDMGGSAQNTLLSCIGLSRKKYQVILVYGLSLESKMVGIERETLERLIKIARTQGVKFVSMRTLVRKIDPIKDLLALFVIYKLLKREHPDILHVHTSKAGFLGRWAGKLSNVHSIVHTAHGHVFYGHFGRALSRFYLLLEKLTAPITDRVITLTEGEKKDYFKYSLYSPEKIRTIHSGVEINRFLEPSIDIPAKRAALGLKQNGRVVGTVGWLLPIKAPVSLLKAMFEVWKLFSDASLIFVGKGPLLHDLTALTVQNGFTEKVRFLGWRDDVHEIMSVLDLFVLPSLNEGMGRVLVEAMAAGRPIVATRTGGIPDLVKDGENGLLVPPGDEKALAAAINYILKNPDQAERMGNNGRKICRKFTIESMVEKIDALYRELIFR